MFSVRPLREKTDCNILCVTERRRERHACCELVSVGSLIQEYPHHQNVQIFDCFCSGTITKIGPKAPLFSFLLVDPTVKYSQSHGRAPVNE